MAWVKGIREVHYVDVPIDADHPGPIAHRRERMVVDLPPDAISRTIQRGQWFLPLHTGAGPCGTSIKGALCTSLVHRWSIVQGVARRGNPLAWSLVYLWPKLVDYYAAYEPPMRFGAKPGPRGRRAA